MLQVFELDILLLFQLFFYYGWLLYKVFLLFFINRHICKKMSDWLTDRLEASQKADKVELTFRPFLKWLDKAAEQMFTDGLTMVSWLPCHSWHHHIESVMFCIFYILLLQAATFYIWKWYLVLLQYKRELAAKAAGFTFIHHTELQRPAEEVSTAYGVNDDDTPAAEEAGASAAETTSERDEQLSAAMSTSAVLTEQDDTNIPTKQVSLLARLPAMISSLTSLWRNLFQQW